ncbi:hypothetical protein CONPUDRAFT_70532 [Coniophora puteana RWD-64-598 SS2]|uniref:Uncharacterized protein n=1 Tax=Coniophora puteana (strain RWD-64-598) TaxID=741705 RepID=A0A5M3N3D3_CONPW|nr:uncharacterized protein CONPUDRAFT_70532 [Coniophora puteana RWD-64-598 SS2]EIW85836.1 hypothetical protein CONPUDRAFT_70532 [Coniophora puteana RWD-64-598 SS2]
MRPSYYRLQRGASNVRLYRNLLADAKTVTVVLSRLLDQREVNESAVVNVYLQNVDQTDGSTPTPFALASRPYIGETDLAARSLDDKVERSRGLSALVGIAGTMPTVALSVGNQLQSCVPLLTLKRLSEHSPCRGLGG